MARRARTTEKTKEEQAKTKKDDTWDGAHNLCRVQSELLLNNLKSFLHSLQGGHNWIRSVLGGGERGSKGLWLGSKQVSKRKRMRCPSADRQKISIRIWFGQSEAALKNCETSGREGKEGEGMPQGFSNFTHFQNYNVATSVALTAAAAQGEGQAT